MLLDFFYFALDLKKIPRKGWVNKVGIKNPESVADHSYATAILAMVLSDNNRLDTEKILKMSLLHDLAESITGDFVPDEISKKDKKTLENKAMRKIFGKLPTELASQYSKVWQEYIQSKTKESVLLHEVDKLEMAIQAAKYSSEGFSNEKLRIFIDSARNKIKSKELLKIIDTISYK